MGVFQRSDSEQWAEAMGRQMLLWLKEDLSVCSA